MAASPRNPDHGWADYLQAHLDSRRWRKIDLANHADLDPSLIGRWLRAQAQPTIESIRIVCETLNRDIREGLVAAGLFTSAEMHMKAPGAVDLMVVSDDDLLLEVRRRMRPMLISGPALAVDFSDETRNDNHGPTQAH